MESNDTFAMYLHGLGIDMRGAYQRYVKDVSTKHEFILTWMAREYPDEFIAWKAKQRILGDETA